MSLLTRWLESLSESITVNENCLRHVSPFSKCTKCQEVCPENAVDLSGDRVTIDEKACTECGKCMTICPAQAVEGSVPKRSVVNDTLMVDRAIAPSYKEWLYYYHKGIRKVAADEQLNDSWQESLQEANRYLEQMESEPLVVTDATPQEESKEYSRRELFSVFAKESKTVALSSLTPAKWRFNHTAFSLNKAFPEWSFYSVTMDKEKCTLCEVCFKLCPTKAFRIGEEKVEIDFSNCTGCELCMDVCRESAITVTESIQKESVATYDVVSGVCESCKEQFISWEGEKVCPICQKPKQSLFPF